MPYIQWFTERGSGRELGAREGFAVTADAYREFLELNALRERVSAHLEDLHSGFRSLADVGESIRTLFLDAVFPEPITQAIRDAYRRLCDRHADGDVYVVLRDDPSVDRYPVGGPAPGPGTSMDAGSEDALLEACRRCYASLFADRAIGERMTLVHHDVALAVGVRGGLRSGPGRPRG